MEDEVEWWSTSPLTYALSLTHTHVHTHTHTHAHTHLALPRRGRKRSLYDGGVRLPFILALPGRGFKGVGMHVCRLHSHTHTHHHLCLVELRDLSNVLEPETRTIHAMHTYQHTHAQSKTKSYLKDPSENYSRNRIQKLESHP